MKTKALLSAFLVALIIGSLLLVGTATSVSIPSTSWAMTYGGVSADEARSVIQTSDGGYAIAGSTQSFGHGGWDMWLVKTNPDGQIQWNQTYGTVNDDSGSQIIQLIDGGYAVVGSIWNQTSSRADLFLVRVDSQGNAIWNLEYPMTNPSYDPSGLMTRYGGSSSIVQGVDGSFVLCFTRNYRSSSGMQAMADMGVIKVNATGQVIWEKLCNPYGMESEANKIIQTTEGGYALAGFWTGVSGGVGALCLIKIDANGTQQWVNTFGDNNQFDIALSLIQTLEGGYAITGYTNSKGYPDFCLIKTGPLGDQTWFKTFGGTGDDQAYSLVQTTDGGYALAGYTDSFGAGGHDIWLVRTDPSGNMKWNNTYGGAGNDFAYSLIATSDGGFALAGGTTSFGAGSEDFFLVKVADINPTPSPTVTSTPTSAQSLSPTVTSTPTSAQSLSPTVTSTPTSAPSLSPTNTNATPNSTPPLTPSAPEFSSIIVAIVLLVALTLTLSVFKKRAP